MRRKRLGVARPPSGRCAQARSARAAAFGRIRDPRLRCQSFTCGSRSACYARPVLEGAGTARKRALGSKMAEVCGPFAKRAAPRPFSGPLRASGTSESRASRVQVTRSAREGLSVGPNARPERVARGPKAHFFFAFAANTSRGSWKRGLACAARSSPAGSIPVSACPLMKIVVSALVPLAHAPEVPSVLLNTK